MTTITGPILDASGRPAEWTLFIGQSARFSTSSGLVTESRAVAVVTGGVPKIKQADGTYTALTLPGTPEDQATVILEQHADGSTLTRWVTIPSAGSAAYGDLEDLVPVGSSGPYGVPSWLTDFEDAMDTLKDDTQAARDETVADVDGPSNWTGAVSLDTGSDHALERTLTGDVTLTVSGTTGRREVTDLLLKQDATGSRTLKVVNALTAYAVTVTLSTAANAVDYVELIWWNDRVIVVVGAQQVGIPTGWVV